MKTLLYKLTNPRNRERGGAHELLIPPEVKYRQAVVALRLTKEPCYSSTPFTTCLATCILVLAGEKEENDNSSTAKHVSPFPLYSERYTQCALPPKKSWRDAENQPSQVESSDELIHPGVLLSGSARASR